MNAETADMLTFDRLQFAASIIFHYLFPQLTMGLAFMIALFATRGCWRGHEPSKRAVRFWTKVFTMTFAFGVATAWFILIGVTLAGFAVTDGFDLGVGILSPLIARDIKERGAVQGTIRNVWTGNEV
jgi:cytochrome bd-type quinol oxidase subunit 2